MTIVLTGNSDKRHDAVPMMSDQTKFDFTGWMYLHQPKVDVESSMKRGLAWREILNNYVENYI